MRRTVSSYLRSCGPSIKKKLISSTCVLGDRVPPPFLVLPDMLDEQLVKKNGA
jgi:hypothetical protein